MLANLFADDGVNAVVHIGFTVLVFELFLADYGERILRIGGHNIIFAYGLTEVIFHFGYYLRKLAFIGYVTDCFAVYGYLECQGVKVC